MSSGTDLIHDALQEIGAYSVTMPASPQSVEAGRRKLNSMMELWLSNGLILGTTPLEAAGDDLNEPDDCRNCIVTNLALELAPMFSTGSPVVSQILVRNAQNAYALVQKLYRTIAIPTKTISSTTPRGAGNRGGAYRGIYFPRGTKITN